MTIADYIPVTFLTENFIRIKATACITLFADRPIAEFHCLWTSDWIKNRIKCCLRNFRQRIFNELNMMSTERRIYLNFIRQHFNHLHHDWFKSSFQRSVFILFHQRQNCCNSHKLAFRKHDTLNCKCRVSIVIPTVYKIIFNGCIISGLKKFNITHHCTSWYFKLFAQLRCIRVMTVFNIICYLKKSQSSDFILSVFHIFILAYLKEFYKTLFYCYKNMLE